MNRRAQSRWRLDARCLALASGALLSGCLLPLPDHGDGETQLIAADAVEKLVIGKTSRTDVLMLLGDPSWRGPEDRQLEYAWEAVVGYFGIGYGYGGTGGAIKKPRRLCLAFDDKDVLAAKHLLQPGIFGKKGVSCPHVTDQPGEG
jgi:hypothetical protein